MISKLYVKKPSRFLLKVWEAWAGFEPAMTVLQTGALPLGYHAIHMNDSNGNRTRVTAVKGRCLNRLTMEPKTPRVGLEPTTTRLTAECSTIELSRKIRVTNVSAQRMKSMRWELAHISIYFICCISDIVATEKLCFEALTTQDYSLKTEHKI